MTSEEMEQRIKAINILLIDVLGMCQNAIDLILDLRTTLQEEKLEMMRRMVQRAQESRKDKEGQA